LNLLKKNDIVKIFINDRIVFYTVTDKYKINKTGKFKYHDKNAYLYLITCDKNNNDKQIVVVGKIVKIMKKSTFF
jgi:sortase (surface protein transpeptidase)